MKLKIINLVALFLVLVLFASCRIYSFTGASLHPDIKTITVNYFDNNSNNGPPNLGQLFTEKLRDYYQRNTKLSLDNTNSGDLIVEGAITSWTLTPIAPTASTAINATPSTSATRLTITVKVNYKNSKEPATNFNQAFSRFVDILDNENLSQVERQKIDIIFEQIVFDIFTKTVANW